MNYNESSIKKKRQNLYSKKNRVCTFVSSMTFRIVLLVICAVLIGGAGFLYGSFKGILKSTPSNYSLTPKNSATIIYDDQKKEVQRLSDYSSNRILVKYDQLPDHLKNAFISIEDERFYEHNGIDVKGILRALWNNIRTGSSEGASTLTQQLIKNNVFHAGNEQNLLAKIQRKIQEQYLALKVEKNTSKESILTNYLNTINLGKGNLGVEAASKYYFNKTAEDLTLSECAVLAAITKNPSKLNPVDHPEDNNARRKLVLEKMYHLNYITNEEYQKALDDNVYARIAKNTTQGSKNSVYSYFTDALITQIVSDLQEQKGYTQSQAYRLVYRGGLRVYSTQNTQMQSIADSVINNPDNYPVETKYSLEYKLQVKHKNQTTETYTETDVRAWFRNKKKDPNYRTIYQSKKELKKAAVNFRKATVKKSDTVLTEEIHYSMEPQVSYSLINQKNGEVKVLVGGRGEKNDDLALNRATAVKRQPGSTFKILSTYAPALDTGGMTLATVFDDAPYRYENGDKVTNYVPTSYKGLTTIRDAITSSNNIVAVKALTEITPQVGYDFLQKLGFTSLVNNRLNTYGAYESDVNQSLALGGITDGVTNLELTAAYAAIANDGQYNKPILYTTVTDSNGKVLLKNTKSSERVIKKSTSWLLTNAMEDVVKKGTGKKARLSSDMAVAGKTGTTSNNYDYWFCGYTPYYTASIWTGYDYNTSFDSDDYHKVIWKKIMDQIIQKKKQATKQFDTCKGIKKVAICIKSGKKAIPGVCSKDPEKSMVRTEYFVSGTQPKESCDAHVKVTLCTKSHRVATKFCPNQYKQTKIFRVRPDHSSGKTDDTPYCLTFNIQKNKCDIHTKEWKLEQEKNKRQKEEDNKKKQLKQNNEQNHKNDNLDDLKKQINRILR